VLLGTGFLQPGGIRSSVVGQASLLALVLFFTCPRTTVYLQFCARFQPPDRFCFFICYGFLQVKAGIVLELLDQKTRVFLALVVLLWWFIDHAHKVFDKMSVRL
jgi:uncharacterized membrane protein